MSALNSSNDKESDITKKRKKSACLSNPNSMVGYSKVIKSTQVRSPLNKLIFLSISFPKIYLSAKSCSFIELPITSQSLKVKYSVTRGCRLSQITYTRWHVPSVVKVYQARWNYLAQMALWDTLRVVESRQPLVHPRTLKIRWQTTIHLFDEKEHSLSSNAHMTPYFR